jgi:hypothetical protein
LKQLQNNNNKTVYKNITNILRVAANDARPIPEQVGE